MKAQTKASASETKGMLQYIPVKDIFAHPDNPRKDLGDLTELSDSIRENGILQNLTVVPRTSAVCKAPAGQYTVLIGHRRLAAAVQAGLASVPCIVVSMTIPEQIETMLMENMQRMDLTLFEQANGFQMMLDLGGSIKDVAGATGFSEATVRRRIKLLDLNLDAVKLQASAARNVSIQDYLELEKVESLETRNRLLEVIGTDKFETQLRCALYDEERERNTARWVELLSGFAKQVKTNKGYRSVAYINPGRDPETYSIPKDHQETKYFFFVEHYGLNLLVKGDEASAQAPVDRERAGREARKAALDEATNRAYELRRGFAKDLPFFRIQVQGKAINEAFVRHAVRTSYASIARKTLSFVSGVDLGGQYGDLKPDALQQYMRLYQDSPVRGLWLVAYSCMESSDVSYYEYNLAFKSNERLNNLYDLLESLGYAISDEEAELMKGTHEMFRRAEPDEAADEAAGDDEDEDAEDQEADNG